MEIPSRTCPNGGVALVGQSPTVSFEHPDRYWDVMCSVCGHVGTTGPDDPDPPQAGALAARHMADGYRKPAVEPGGPWVPAPDGQAIAGRALGLLTLTSARRSLADHITAIIVAISPADMDGTTIVARLTASPEGRKALCAVAQELNAEAIQAGMKDLGDAVADGFRQVGRALADAMRPKPTTGDHAGKDTTDD